MISGYPGPDASLCALQVKLSEPNDVAYYVDKGVYMRQTTVRIRETAHDKLRARANAEHRPMNDVLEEAIETYRRIRFLSDVNAGYAALRRDPSATAAWKREIADLDKTLLDGLPREEPVRAAPPHDSKAMIACRWPLFDRDVLLIDGRSLVVSSGVPDDLHADRR